MFIKRPIAGRPHRSSAEDDGVRRAYASSRARCAPTIKPATWNFSMNVMRSLWASIQGDPVFMRRVNGWLTVFWVVMIPISLVTGWISSVTYVAALSLWALVSGHWSAWQAARVEVKPSGAPAQTDRAPTWTSRGEGRLAAV
jgi:hypothetical protein